MCSSITTENKEMFRTGNKLNATISNIRFIQHSNILIMLWFNIIQRYSKICYKLLTRGLLVNPVLLGNRVNKCLVGILLAGRHIGEIDVHLSLINIRRDAIGENSL
jgi:hypothetical protein